MTAPQSTTSAVGFAARFTQLEAQFTELRATTLQAVGDGKLTWMEVITLGQQIEVMIRELHTAKDRLEIVKDGLRARG
jgi:hypothetical protein